MGKLVISWDATAGAPGELSDGLLSALVSRNALTPGQASDIARLVQAQAGYSFDTAIPAAKEVRKLLGFAAVDWLSSQDITNDPEELLERSPRAEIIDPDDPAPLTN